MLPTFHITLATHLAEMDPWTQKSTESFPPIFIKDIILLKITDCFPGASSQEEGDSQDYFKVISIMKEKRNRV